MCDCPTNLDLNDDSKDGDWCCAEAEQEFAGSFDHCEPVEDPQPLVLFPENHELPIEALKANPKNSAALFKAFLVGIGHMQAQNAQLSEADVLAAIMRIVRGYAVQTVVQRAHYNVEAAVANKVLILHKLEVLIDEILKIDLPQPKVN